MHTFGENITVSVETDLCHNLKHLHPKRSQEELKLPSSTSDIAVSSCSQAVAITLSKEYWFIWVIAAEQFLESEYAVI